MKKLMILFILFLTNVFIISGLCGENQIDVNSASIEELDNLYGIGSAKAQSIVDSRFFESVDDLINVKGIGEITLAKIKEQNFACVKKEEENLKKEIEEEKEKENIEEVDEKEILNEEVYEKIKQEEIYEKAVNIKEEKKNLEIIKLMPQTIKSENNTKKLNKDAYVKYGFVIFSVLLGSLFILKGKTNKNEFN